MARSSTPQREGDCTDRNADDREGPHFLLPWPRLSSPALNERAEHPSICLAPPHGSSLLEGEALPLRGSSWKDVSWPGRRGGQRGSDSWPGLFWMCAVRLHWDGAKEAAHKSKQGIGAGDSPKAGNSQWKEEQGVRKAARKKRGSTGRPGNWSQEGGRKQGWNFSQVPPPPPSPYLPDPHVTI